MPKNAGEAKGNIYYGMHFYPGLAGYQEENGRPYKVFLNENTIRSMDPTFAGCPVFVLHVDEVETDLNKLRSEADGWVIESFYNAADGKHWAKFVVVSEEGKKAIAKGMKLSNCYLPKTFGPSGMWNGIDYEKSITSAEYEHLAIVPNPRYEESVIMTPDEFKKYNDDHQIELKRLANTKGEEKMAFNFFKRAKVENSTDLEGMLVELPKSKVEVHLAHLINMADKEEMEKDKPKVAEGHHLVDCNGKTMTVNEMVEKHKAVCDELEEMKKPKEEENAEDDDMEHAKEKPDMSADDKDDDKAELKLREEEDKEVKDAKKKNDKEKADRLRNANKFENHGEEVPFLMSEDAVARGKAMFGSN